MRFGTLLLFALAALAACGGGTSTDPRADIEDAIERHLSRRSDLDIASMKVSVGKIDYEGDDRARATVGFQVGDNPEASMQMVYDLRREGGQWQVQQTGGSGHGEQVSPPATAPGAGGELPADHPPIGSQPQSQQQQDLPAGHPPVE